MVRRGLVLLGLVGAVLIATVVGVLRIPESRRASGVARKDGPRPHDFSACHRSQRSRAESRIGDRPATSRQFKSPSARRSPIGCQKGRHLTSSRG